MAANTNPIFSIVPHIGWGTSLLTTANAAYDGTGTVLGAFTAGSNGSFVQRIRFRAAGTNIAAVARIFINNGSTNTSAANNILFDEITLSATTASQTGATVIYELPLNFGLPANYVINVTIGTTVSAGYYVSVVGGDY